MRSMLIGTLIGCLLSFVFNYYRNDNLYQTIDELNTTINIQKDTINKLSNEVRDTNFWNKYCENQLRSCE